MPTFGGSTSTTGYTEDYVSSSGITIPEGRLAANGKHPVRVTSISGYAAGRGAARSCTLSLGSASTSSFTLGANSSAKSTGSKSISLYVSDGTSTTFKINASGSFYFGRGGSGTAVDSFGTSFSGKLGGSFSYDEAPSAPRSPIVTRDSSSATVTWTAPSDNGGSSITDYRIQYSTSSSFSSPTTVESSGTGRTKVVTGLTPGVTYYFRVAAINAVTDHYNTSSVYSSTATAPASGGIGEVWNGTAWVTAATVEAWNGTAWVPAATVEVWNGTAWVASS